MGLTEYVFNFLLKLDFNVFKAKPFHPLLLLSLPQTLSVKGSTYDRFLGNKGIILTTRWYAFKGTLFTYVLWFTRHRTQISAC